MWPLLTPAVLIWFCTRTKSKVLNQIISALVARNRISFLSSPSNRSLLTPIPGWSPVCFSFFLCSVGRTSSSGDLLSPVHWLWWQPPLLFHLTSTPNIQWVFVFPSVTHLISSFHKPRFQPRQLISPFHFHSLQVCCCWNVCVTEFFDLNYVIIIIQSGVTFLFITEIMWTFSKQQFIFRKWWIPSFFQKILNWIESIFSIQTQTCAVKVQITCFTLFHFAQLSSKSK